MFPATRLANTNPGAPGDGRPFNLLKPLARDYLLATAKMVDSSPVFAARNAAGHTPVHVAARHGELLRLPAEALTAKYLTLKNDAGYTPLHHAAIGGHLDQVPRTC